MKWTLVAVALGLLALALVLVHRPDAPVTTSAVPTPAPVTDPPDTFAAAASEPSSTGEAHQSLLYGRITDVDGAPPGHPLLGRVTTRRGRQLAGRLVWDLDESETTETLDAPSSGLDYTIPFGLVASVELPDHDRGEPNRNESSTGGALVTLHDDAPPASTRWSRCGTRGRPSLSRRRRGPGCR